MLVAHPPPPPWLARLAMLASPRLLTRLPSCGSLASLMSALLLKSWIKDLLLGPWRFLIPLFCGKERRGFRGQMELPVVLAPCQTLSGHPVTSLSSPRSSPFLSGLVGRRWASHRWVRPVTPTPSSGGVLHPDSGSGVSFPCSATLVWCHAQWSVLLYSHAFP